MSRNLQDIVENIDRIERYTAGLGRERLYADDMRLDAVECCLQRVMDAAARLGDDGPTIAPAIPWTELRKFGNHLRHDYDRLDEHVVWHTIVNDLPPLKSACLAAMSILPDSNS